MREQFSKKQRSITVCSYSGTYAFLRKPALYSCLNVSLIKTK